MLLRSCRGHDAEITDLAVSADNRLLASGDTAHQIRVWSLQVGAGGGGGGSSSGRGGLRG